MDGQDAAPPNSNQGVETPKGKDPESLTVIPVKRKTAARIKALKRANRESYDEILDRVLPLPEPKVVPTAAPTA